MEKSISRWKWRQNVFKNGWFGTIKKEITHYDIISAFIKSMRGSDPDAAVYYLAKMLYAGEDVKFIARRIMILASEDIGNADPQALCVAVAAAQAVERVGNAGVSDYIVPGSGLYGLCAKSNSAVNAISAAMDSVKKKKNYRSAFISRTPITEAMKSWDMGSDTNTPIISQIIM